MILLQIVEDARQNKGFCLGRFNWQFSSKEVDKISLNCATLWQNLFTVCLLKTKSYNNNCYQFVLQQENDFLFNKGILMNAGFLESPKFSEWDCIIFHDIDHIPQHEGNPYHCVDLPRHLMGGADNRNYRQERFLFSEDSLSFSQWRRLKFSGSGCVSRQQVGNVTPGWMTRSWGILSGSATRGQVKTIVQRHWTPLVFVKDQYSHHGVSRKKKHNCCTAVCAFRKCFRQSLQQYIIIWVKNYLFFKNQASFRGRHFLTVLYYVNSSPLFVTK